MNGWWERTALVPGSSPGSSTSVSCNPFPMYPSKLRISEGGRLIGISSFVGTQFTSWNFFAWTTRTSGNVENRDRLQDRRGEVKENVTACSGLTYAQRQSSCIVGRNIPALRPQSACPGCPPMIRLYKLPSPLHPYYPRGQELRR